MKGKNKLVPRLLGITKDSVMRVDEKTKEVLQEWPLTTVKRWAASPKSFTLVWAAGGHEGTTQVPGWDSWGQKKDQIVALKVFLVSMSLVNISASCGILLRNVSHEAKKKVEQIRNK